MKAWQVTSTEVESSIIVFAETASKAKQIALTEEDIGENSLFTELRAHRDKQGKDRLDWNNDEDRIILVREFGFTCIDRIDYFCEICSAKKYCPYFVYDEEDDE